MGGYGILNHTNINNANFAGIYDSFVSKIYDFHFYRTLHRETAEDLTSLTFTKAWQHYESYNPNKGTIQTWIYRIARNTLIDHYRTKKHVEKIDDNWDVWDGADMETDLDNRERLKKIKNKITSMPPKHRDLLMMRIWEGLSFKEIALITGRTETSLKVAASRLLSVIRRGNLILFFTALIILNT